MHHVCLQCNIFISISFYFSAILNWISSAYQLVIFYVYVNNFMSSTEKPFQTDVLCCASFYGLRWVGRLAVIVSPP